MVMVEGGNVLDRVKKEGECPGLYMSEEEMSYTYSLLFALHRAVWQHL